MIDKEIITTHQAYIQTNREIKEQKSITSKPSTKILKNENWKVYHKSSDDLSEIKNEEIQTIFTSPPYWNKRTYLEGGGLGNEPKPHQYIENLSNHLKECFRVLNIVVLMVIYFFSFKFLLNFQTPLYQYSIFLHQSYS